AEVPQVCLADVETAADAMDELPRRDEWVAPAERPFVSVLQVEEGVAQPARSHRLVIGAPQRYSNKAGQGGLELMHHPCRPVKTSPHHIPRTLPLGKSNPPQGHSPGCCPRSTSYRVLPGSSGSRDADVIRA